MKFAFSKSTQSDEEVRGLISGYRAAGYEGLQLKPNHYRDYLDEPERFAQDWGSDPGTVSALITLGNLSDEGIESLRKVFRFASAVGTERVVMCHYIPREGLTAGDIRAIARDLSALGKEARAQGVALSLHHHYNNPVMHREDFDVFFGAVEDGAVGLTLDTAHLVKSGVSDIAELIRGLHPVIDNFHLKDFANGEFMVLGDGEIDFAPIFAAISDVGYDGWVSADEESGSELAGAMSRCMEFIKKGFAPYGGIH
jgi:sugar phosphate isomerase/epimerase